MKNIGSCVKYKVLVLPFMLIFMAILGAIFNSVQAVDLEFVAGREQGRSNN